VFELEALLRSERAKNVSPPETAPGPDPMLVKALMEEATKIKMDFDTMMARCHSLTEQITAMQQQMLTDNDRHEKERLRLQQDLEEARLEKNDLIAHISHLKSLAPKAKDPLDGVDVLTHPLVQKRMAELEAKNEVTATRKAEAIHRQLRDQLRESEVALYESRQRLQSMERHMMSASFQSQDLLRQLGLTSLAMFDNVEAACTSAKCTIFESSSAAVKARHGEDSQLSFRLAMTHLLCDYAKACLGCRPRSSQEGPPPSSLDGSVGPAYRNLCRVVQSMSGQLTPSSRLSLCDCITRDPKVWLTSEVRINKFTSLVSDLVQAEHGSLEPDAIEDIEGAREWLVRCLRYQGYRQARSPSPIARKVTKLPSPRQTATTSANIRPNSPANFHKTPSPIVKPKVSTVTSASKNPAPPKPTWSPFGRSPRDSRSNSVLSTGSGRVSPAARPVAKTAVKTERLDPVSKAGPMPRRMATTSSTSIKAMAQKIRNGF